MNMEEERPTADNLPGEDYRLAVAIGNPANSEQLVRTAADIAMDRDGELLVLSTVVKPDASPASVYEDDIIKRQFSGDRAAVLDRATETAAETGVPVAGQLLVADSVSAAIVDAVREFDCDGVLLGWHQRQRRDAILGSNVDRVLERAPCDVLVERIATPVTDVESVLLPVARSPHVDLAASVARAIARSNNAAIEVLHVLDPDASSADRDAAEGLLEEAAAELSTVTHETRLVTGADITDTIVDAADDHEVVVLGATRHSDLQRRLVGSVSEAVGRRASSISILARRARSRSQVRHWMRRLVPFA